MKKYQLWSVIGVSFLIAENLSAITNSNAAKPGFTLLDKICVEVEGESPILLSEIKKKMETNGVSFLDAKDELIQDRLLWVYAKKQLKYDIGAIYKAADDHIAKVIKSNGIDEKKFEKLLMQSPYFTTLRQFKKDTATEVLRNSIRQNISSQVSITDEQIREEMMKRDVLLSQNYDVVFVTISPPKNATGPSRGARTTRLNREFKRANEIRPNLTVTNSINDIKKLYGDDKNISIIGPIGYEKGALKKAYEDRLKSGENNSVVGPFEDDGSVTMIWKVKRTGQKMDVTALEKVKKELYDKAVMEKFKTVTGAFLDNSTVIVKNCGKP